MKFITYAVQGKQYPGVVSFDGKRAISLAECGLQYTNLEELARYAGENQLNHIKNWLTEHMNAGLPLESVTLLPAIPAPTQEILIMENNFIPDGAPLPTYFYKKATYANCNGGRIPTYPGHVTQLDYQAELCAVVAGDVYQIQPEDAHRHIFGYLIINNVIARNLTLRHRRPYIATSLDGFLPMSSYLVTPDEITEPIQIRCWVNGQLRQDETADKAKFSFAYAISDLSRISVLRGGSIISLGTPFGSGMDQTPPVYLQSGDTVTCEAAGIGTITNIVE